MSLPESNVETLAEEHTKKRACAYRRFHAAIQRQYHTLSPDDEIELANEIADALGPYYFRYEPKEYILLTTQNSDRHWITEIGRPIDTTYWQARATGTVVAGRPAAKRAGALEGLLWQMRSKDERGERMGDIHHKFDVKYRGN